MQFREKFQINTIMNIPNGDENEKLLRVNYPHGYCGVAKNGYPIYIERDGHIKADAVNADFPETDDVLRIFARSYERLQRHIMLALSH